MLRRSLVTVIATFGLASSLLAADEGGKIPPDGSSGPIIDERFPDSKEGISLHHNNRAVAFGALLIQAQAPDIDTWQAIEAYNGCIINEETEESTLPRQGMGLEKNGKNDGDVSDSLNCWSVDVITDYQLQVCPDGIAYISRSGVGVFLHNRHVGEVYSWSEENLCGGLDLPSKYSLLDRFRPLSRSGITRRLLGQ